MWSKVQLINGIWTWYGSLFGALNFVLIGGVRLTRLFSRNAVSSPKFLMIADFQRPESMTTCFNPDKIGFVFNCTCRKGINSWHWALDIYFTYCMSCALTHFISLARMSPTRNTTTSAQIGLIIRSRLWNLELMWGGGTRGVPGEDRSSGLAVNIFLMIKSKWRGEELLCMDTRIEEQCSKPVKVGHYAHFQCILQCNPLNPNPYTRRKWSVPESSVWIE